MTDRTRTSHHGDRYTIDRPAASHRWNLREGGEIIASFLSESKARAVVYAVNLYDSGAYGALEARVADLRADLALVRVGFESAVRELRGKTDEEADNLRTVEDKLKDLRASATSLEGIADDLARDGQARAELECRSEADALRDEAANLAYEAGLA